MKKLMKTIPIQLIKDAVYCVNYLVYKNDDGAREHLYLATRHDQMKSLQNAIRQGNFEAEDYGIVLEQGAGEASKIVKEKMQLLYKCNHNSGISVLDYDPGQE